MLIFRCTQFLLALRFCIAIRSKKHFKLFRFRSREDCFSNFLSCKPIKLDFISFFALPFLELSFVDAVKQNNHFSQIQVACENACLLVVFLRPTPSSGAFKAGVAFAFFCKRRDRFESPLDEFVRHFFVSQIHNLTPSYLEINHLMRQLNAALFSRLIPALYQHIR